MARDKIKSDEVYGKLTVLYKTDMKDKNGKGQFYWNCLCECGKETLAVQCALLSGHKKSCGCQRVITTREVMGYHGLSKTKAYRAWKSIKKRCFNKNDQDYERYSKLGMSEAMSNDFLVFLADIGNPPTEESKWSVDRIDTTIGYFEGNMQWVTQKEQTRNRKVSGRNKSGIHGVHYRDGSRNCYVAYWRDINGKQRSKSFSVNKYGSELALFLAQEYRTTMMERLNLLGAGYTHYHIYGELKND